VNENQLAERMRAAVAGEPPLGFDPDELTDRAARSQRQRRVVFGAAAVTLVIAATAATAVTVGAVGQGGGHGVGSQPSVTPALNCPEPMATLAPTVIARHLPAVVLDGYRVECGQMDVQYLEPGGRIWLYREERRTEPWLDFFADNEFAYHRLSEQPVPGATVRTYEEAPNTEGARLLAAVYIGTNNSVVWAEVSAHGPLVATEEQLVALVSDPELR
jgi:hypothetical protein